MAKITVKATAIRLDDKNKEAGVLVNNIELGVFDNEQMALEFIAGLPTKQSCPALRKKK